MLWPALILIVSTTLQASVSDVVYGEDNRLDVYDSANPQFVELAKSTAGMIPRF